MGRKKTTYHKMEDLFPIHALNRISWRLDRIIHIPSRIRNALLICPIDRKPMFLLLHSTARTVDHILKNSNKPNELSDRKLKEIKWYMKKERFGACCTHRFWKSGKVYPMQQQWHQKNVVYFKCSQSKRKNKTKQSKLKECP